MDPLYLGLIVGVLALIFLFSGMPIAFALGAVSLLIMLLFMTPFQFDMIAQVVYSGMENFGLLAVPLFIFMGIIVAATRAGSDLYECFHKWLNRVPGGLGMANVVSCAIFAALTGSSPATAAAIGSTGIPELRKRGYDASLACGIICAGGTLGILIPPSVTMIVYGIATETSIGKLFIAGILPGLMITTLFCAWILLVYMKKRRKLEDTGNPSAEVLFETFTLSEKLSASVKIFPFLLIITLVLFSLYGGWATPSEAAGVGGFCILLVAMVIYKAYTPAKFKEIMLRTLKETTMIMMIIAMSFLFSSILTELYITQTIAESLVKIETSRWVIMFFINIMLLVVGCFLPPVAAILILAPILHPVITRLGFDPVWFGVIMTVNLEVGLITPPVGLNLYVIQGIAPDITIDKVLRGSFPFVVLLILSIVIVSIFPGLATWLPAQMIGF
ncbi:MAG: TRAP transporter large permease [Desulfoferrobacter sp.]